MTEVLEPDVEDANHIAALEALAQGGVVAHATEGVWGLSCDPMDAGAVEKILNIKGRDRAKGLIVIGGDVATFAPELADLESAMRAQICDTWPGPHTWILPNVRFSEAVTGGRETVACRVPGHSQARALAARFGSPIVSTSANRSGEVAATEEAEVRRLFSSEVDFILPGQVLNPGVPSTIHTLHGETLRR